MKTENESLSMNGWGDAKRCATVNQVIGWLLCSTTEVDRCFILGPEWHDPSDIFTAIGHHLIASKRSAASG